MSYFMQLYKLNSKTRVIKILKYVSIFNHDKFNSNTFDKHNNKVCNTYSQKWHQNILINTYFLHLVRVPYTSKILKKSYGFLL